MAAPADDRTLPTAHAPRAAFVIDNEAYFAFAREAMSRARRSIHLLGWAFDHRLDLGPRDTAVSPSRQVGPLLVELAAKRPELDVRVLIWKPTFPVEPGLISNADRARRFFAGGPVHFHLDGTAPLGASHHTKMLVIDDAVAFCGGADMSDTRWDTPDHLDDNPRRRDPNGKPYPPRHSVTCVVDGEAARALGAIARERWAIATGTPPPARVEAQGETPWPPLLATAIAETPVTITRTRAAMKKWPEQLGNIETTLDAISSAQSFIYSENELMAAPAVRDALARRLAEPEGPEVVLVTGARAPSLLSRLTVDPARDVLIRQLHAADRNGRLRVFAPCAPHGRPIIVHSKLMIVDDRFVRIGSANLNNRSIAFDSECGLAIEATPGDGGEAARRAIRTLRAQLIAHHTGGDAGRIEQAGGGLVAAIESVNAAGRLTPILPGSPRFPTALIARYHLGDPVGVADVWRPWLRRR